MNRILVTAKVNPDIDGTACTLAYADLLRQTGREADGIVTGSFQSEVGYFSQKQGVLIPARADENADKWDAFILVDASSIKGMPKVVLPDQVIEVIDHRIGEPEREFPQALVDNPLIGAAATIVVERFIKAEKVIKPDLAKLLYGAIYHNTLNFIATNAGQRDREAAGYLESTYKLEKGMIREMFDFATAEIKADVETALENDAKEFGGGWKIGAYQLIVWGSELLTDKKTIAEAVERLGLKTGSEWGFVNIVDLETKKSYLYSGATGRPVLAAALGVTFQDGWTIAPAMLRKQIMPKVYEIVDKQ